jgi:SAM-dependent methyltransferase
VPPLAPFASALAAYAGGETDVELRLRSSLGENEALPVGFFFRTPDELMDFERYALELCRGRVLDLGAGAGPHTLALQSVGRRVVAVEGSADVARLLRARGASSVVHADFRYWWRPGFDTVLMLMNGLGPVGTLAGLDRFLAHAPRCLAPGGQLLVDGAEAAPSRPSRAAEAASWPPAGEYPGEAWIELSRAGRVGRPFRELYIDPGTLARHATRAGWRLDVVFEGGDGTYLARLARPS